jgi:hypothetical protein
MLRQVAARLAALSIEQSRLSDPRVDQALAALHGQGFGDSSAREALRELAENLDQRQWSLQEAGQGGDPSSASHMLAFRQARAASSVWFALESDPLTATLESAYEAQAASSVASVRDAILEELARS